MVRRASFVPARRDAAGRHGYVRDMPRRLVVLVVVALSPVAAALPAHGAPPPAARVRTVTATSACPGAFALDTTADGEGAHAHMISRAMAVFMQPRRSRPPIAYEYQTYGGREYLQFRTGWPNDAGSGRVVWVTVPPLFVFKGNVYVTFRGALERTSAQRRYLPSALNHLTPNTRYDRLDCIS
jgi:hypothetical protein